MKVQLQDRKNIARQVIVPVFFCLVSLLLTACASSGQTPKPLNITNPPQAAGQAPVILQVTDRQEIVNGYLYYYQDILFTDPDGDAVAVTYTVNATTLPYRLQLPDTPIAFTPREQKVGALYVETTACWQKMELSYTSRILDEAGNLSEPVSMVMSCTLPPAIDTRPLLISGSITAGVIALLLAAGFWLLFRKHPSNRMPAMRSTILMLFLFMVLKFLQFILHEGGHALYLLANHVPVTMYIHPFLFSGFSRPIIVNSSIWDDILGTLTAIPVGLLISLLAWKHRSKATLPWVMLFPYIAIVDGMNLMGLTGDFNNVIRATGLPAFPFLIAGVLIMLVGVTSFLSLLPLAGLEPGDRKVLFVLPAALFLMSGLSFMVSHLFVPGSPIDLAFFVGHEIMRGANSFVLALIVGVVMAVLYITVFPRISTRLPGWMRNETVTLDWKDLLIPGILWAASLVIGLIIVI